MQVAGSPLSHTGVWSRNPSEGSQDTHMKEECARRPVGCRLGCGLKVPYEEREHHEQNVCTRPCMWCGERIGPESRKEVARALPLSEEARAVP